MLAQPRIVFTGRGLRSTTVLISLTPCGRRFLNLNRNLQSMDPQNGYSHRVAHPGISTQYHTSQVIPEKGRLLGLYQVRIRRAPHRWIIDERFERRSEVVLVKDPAKINLEAADLKLPFKPAGTLAAEASQLWQDKSETPGTDAIFKEWSQQLQKLFQIGQLDEPYEAGLSKMIEKRTQWLPVMLRKNAVVLTYGVVHPDNNSFPWMAVYLSYLFGTLTKQLKLCSACQARLLLARQSWDITCPTCHRSAPWRRDPRVRRVLERLRKRDDGGKEFEQATMELIRKTPIPEWLGLHDKRRGPQGRKHTESH
jgi:hypothetical protein